MLVVSWVGEAMRQGGADVLELIILLVHTRGSDHCTRAFVLGELTVDNPGS